MFLKSSTILPKLGFVAKANLHKFVVLNISLFHDTEDNKQDLGPQLLLII